MRPTLDPFRPGATQRLRVRPPRSHSLVVFDSNGVTFHDHPVAGVRHSTLMVMSGMGDLVGNKPRYLAEKLLALPDVKPGELRGRSYVDVPLIQPDELDSTHCTTWTILAKRLLVDQIGSDRAELIVRGAENPDVGTVELRPFDWWHLVRVLVSLDAWMTYLRRELDVHAEAVRRAREAGPVRVQVFHLREDRLVEVFAYKDTAQRGVEGVLDDVLLLAQHGLGALGAAHQAAAGRSLRIGDMVAVDGVFFALGKEGWTAFAGRPSGF